MSDPNAVPQPAKQQTTPEKDELLEAGQEEVFSRTEVELGRIEHASDAGRSPAPHPKPKV